MSMRVPGGAQSMNDNAGLHRTTFAAVTPSDSQKRDMEIVREAFATLAAAVLKTVPNGPDRTYLIRQLRECCMWANVAITRHPDGSPRS